jgi:Uma2 family endonuclease
MNHPARLALAPDEFLAWESRQERKYELVNGVARMMAGGTFAHTLIARSLTIALAARLKGKPCQPFFERKVSMPRGNYRYPDVVVDCGRNAMADLAAKEPRVVFEVESPSTTTLEQLERLEDYQSVASITTIVLLAQTRAQGRVFFRDGAGWRSISIAGMDAAAPIDDLAISLPFAEIYEGVEFPPSHPDEADGP